MCVLFLRIVPPIPFFLQLTIQTSMSDQSLLPSLSVVLILCLGVGCSLDSDPLFQRLEREHTRINFSNTVVDTEDRNILKYEYFYNGGGVSIGDINNDSLPDLFFTSNLGPNRLYLNQGSFRFKDITQQANLYYERDSTWNTGTTMVDINDDGLLDIYVCRSGDLPPEHRSNLLFINQGDTTFAEAAASYGLDNKGYSIQAAFFDYDEDGDLDAYVIGHGAGFYRSGAARQLGGSIGTSAQARTRHTTNRLYENRGKRFADVTGEAGVKGTSSGYALGVATGDLNGDDYDDIYVANDFFEHDDLYFNNGDGTFSQVIKSATRHVPYSSMGVDISDFNNDGRLDLSVLDMAQSDRYRRMMSHAPLNNREFESNLMRGLHYQYSYNTLQLNNGNGTFSDVAWLTGVAQTDWSWAPLFADFNNDGYKDLYITNGIRRNVLHRDYRARIKEALSAPDVNTEDGTFSNERTVRLIENMPHEKVENHMYVNQGDLSFSETSDQWGLNQPTFSNGAAYGDLNNDGALDLVVNNLNAPALIYENRLDTSAHHFLRVRLKGPEDNTDALGAEVEVIHGDTTQYRQKYRTRGYQSSVEGEMHFGLGSTEVVDTLRVTWHNGNVQLQTSVSANQVVAVSHDPSSQAPPPDTTATTPLFTEVTDSLGLDYQHKENRFDDFRHQYLLPHKLSTLGPEIAVGDANGDGREDVFIGGARGTDGTLFVQTSSGSFTRAPSQPWTADREREDMGSLFFDADGDGDLDLYVVSGGNSWRSSSPQLQDRLYVNTGNGTFEKRPDRLPDLRASGASVSTGDYDQDGDQDLFVGGRVKPQQYPMPSRSFLLENRDGEFVDVTKEQAPDLATIGMVTDALWTDVTGDEALELVIAGEWMPLRVFAFDDGTAREKTEALGFSQSQGWWFSLASEDLDGDGNTDVLAGNNGLNFRYQASPERPFHLFAKDYNEDGTVDPILAEYDDNTLYPVVLKEVMAKELRFVNAKFSDHASYARADMEGLLGESLLNSAQKFTVRTFASSRFTRQSDGSFTRTSLPRKAQLSAVTDILVHDLNEDGHSDIILAGNLYEVEPRTPRNDAGNGLVLMGTGNGDFQPLSVSDSGFFAPHNAKALALVETENGPLVLVANNDGPLQVFRGPHDSQQ